MIRENKKQSPLYKEQFDKFDGIKIAPSTITTDAKEARDFLFKDKNLLYKG